MKKLNLFGSGIRGATPTLDTERRLNCYYELVEDEDRTKLTVLGTPGTSIFSMVGSSIVRGFHVFNENLYVIQQNNLYSIDLGGNTNFLGSINTIYGFVSMEDNGYQICIVDGQDGWIYTVTGGLVQITSPGFNPGATTVAFLNGFFILDNPNQNGQWFKSASYDGTTYDGLDFATAESAPDALVAVDSDHGAAILWGGRTIEFWQDIGVLGFPFAPLQGATQQWGLAAKFSRAKFNGTIAFLAQNLQGQCQVMMLQNFVPQRISNHNLETIINSFSIISDAIGMSYMINGHSMYQITFPGLNRSFLYDGSTSLWSETQTGVGLTGRHIANQCFTWRGKSYVTDYTTGNILLLDNTSYTDNGNPIKREVISRHIENDGNVGVIDTIELVIATGVGLTTGQGQYPQMMAQVSKDGGNTFLMAERWRMFGAKGQFLGPRCKWDRWGAAESMVFKFRMTDPVKFAIAYATADVSSMGK